MTPSDAHPSTDHTRHARVLDTVLGSITDFAYAFDLDGRFVYVNNALLQLWGIPLEQAIGKNFHDLKYPEDLAAKLQRQIRQVIETGVRLVDETPYTSPTGAGGYYEYIFSPIFAADGSVELVAGTTRDISKRVAVERERDGLVRTLAAERAKLADVIEHAPAFICTLRGPEHVFEFANGLYNELTGGRPLVGRTVREAFPEIAGQGFFELLDQVYRTGEPFVGNERPIRLTRHGNDPSAGDVRYINFVYQPTRDAGGAITGIFVHGVDVTEMVRARDSISDSESRFRQLADSMPQIVFAASPDGHVDYFNRRWYEYTGLPQGETGYESWRQVHTADGLERAVTQWGESVRTGSPYEIEYELRRHDGQYRWHLGRALPVRAADGRIVRWFGTNTDIHDWRMLQERFERVLRSERAARDTAESANQAKDRFLAALSHELRTPLTPVAMASAAIEHDPRLPADLREDVAMIRRNVDLETQLIDDLLDLNRIMSGKMRLRLQPTSVHRVIRHVLETVGGELHDKRLTVETDLAAGAHDVNADAARLQQVLWNLLKNSAKFTPEGGRVTIRTRDEGGRVFVEVADTGKGIAAGDLARIFEPFEQGSAGVTSQYGGMGLGLAIAKAVVDMHGGTIAASSDGPGCGATFAISLPACATAAASPQDAEGPDATARDGRSVRVLLVEDHPDTAKVLARLLRMEGMEVEWAGTVNAGLELAASAPFDVIVSDLGLPDGTGHDLMRRIRTESRAVGIAMSGYGMEEDIRQSHEAGFAEHLVKPVNLADLRKAIKRVTGRFADGAPR